MIEVIGGLAIVAGLACWVAYRLGRSAARREQAEVVAEVQARQLDAAAEPPLRRDDLLDRLRKTGGL